MRGLREQLGVASLFRPGEQLVQRPRAGPAVRGGVGKKRLAWLSGSPGTRGGVEVAVQ